jgi:WD40 repeat protein
MDGTSRLWNVESGGEIGVFEGHDGPIWGVCIVRDGEDVLVVTGGRDGRILIHDPQLPEGSVLLGSHDDWVWCVACGDLNGRPVIASSSADGTIRLWDLRTRQLERTFAGHQGWVLSARFGTSADGSSVLISTSADRSVRAWEVETGRCLAKVPLGGALDAVASEGRIAVATQQGVVAIDLQPAG